jgi:uncharacterized protein (TIGR02246 family)
MNASATRLVLFLSLAAVSCAAPPAQRDTQADVSAINAVREREIAAVNASAPDSMAAVYSADVAMMPPNEPAVNGQDALRKWLEATFGQVTINGRYTSSQVTVAGDWAIDRYTGVLTVTPKAGGAPIEERIKGIHVMHREADGTWRIAQDVWNADAPAPAAPPAPPAKK